MLVADVLPVVWVVPGLARVVVPAQVGIVAGQFGPVNFRFAAPREVTGILLLPASGLAADLAQLSVQITDEQEDQLISDQVGDARPPRLPFAVPLLSLAGSAFHPYPWAKLVAIGDRWRITVRNSSAAPITIASFSFHHKAIP